MCVVCKAASTSTPGAAPVMWTDVNAKTAHRILQNGTREDGKLKPGPAGCCLAVCPNGDEEATEVPNLLLQAKMVAKRVEEERRECLG